MTVQKEQKTKQKGNAWEYFANILDCQCVIAKFRSILS